MEVNPIANGAMNMRGSHLIELKIERRHRRR
jgi:hypothetical protein